MVSQSIMNCSLILGIVVLSLCLGHLQGAAILCGQESGEAVAVASKSAEESESPAPTTAPTKKPSELNKLLHTVQCSLEKAKPWLENIEKEAKNLEETAKRVGLRIVHSFGDIMDTFLETVGQRKPLIIYTTQKPETEDVFSPTNESSSSSSSTSSSSSSTADSVTVQTTESPLININEAENEIFGLK